MVPPECRRSNWIAVGEKGMPHNPAGKYGDGAMSYSPTGRVLVRNSVQRSIDRAYHKPPSLGFRHTFD